MVNPLDDNLMIAPGVTLKSSKLSFTFSRSGGPGGQNVNKVNTRATLTVSLADLRRAMPNHAMARLQSVAGSAMIDDALQFSSGESRSQIANRRACIEKLRAVLIEAMRRPKIRRKTKPSKRSIQRRIDAKKQRGQIKRLRKNPRRGE